MNRLHRARHRSIRIVANVSGILIRVIAVRRVVLIVQLVCDLHCDFRLLQRVVLVSPSLVGVSFREEGALVVVTD